MFVAFEIPDDRLDAVAAAAGEIQERLHAGRWTTRGQQHVTLKFIGWIEASLLDEVCACCERAARGMRRAAVSLTGVGAFPTPRRARVLWAGIDDPTGLTPELAARLDRELVRVGIQPEDRSYTPHLTLARFKPPHDVRAVVRDAPGIHESFEIAAITLFRSHLAPGGARYEVVRWFDLR